MRLVRAVRTKKLSIMVFVLAAVLLSFASLQWNKSAYAADNSSGLTVPQVIEKATPFVVAIIGKSTEAGSNSTDNSSNRFDLAHGTGVIVGADGVILTNAHVVKNMKSITVVTSDGKSYPGKTTHFDEESDLALVKISATGLAVATFGVQSAIQVGDPVLAIGTPISFALRNTVTQGIVSGMERTVNSQYLLLQTDAAINAGNSGGALLNMKGEVIGINALKYSEVGVDSLGFAIPVDTVQYVLKQFLAYGKVKRPYLGMELEEGWEAVVGLPTQAALKVSYVEPDSPTAKAGVKQGDTLSLLNNIPINTIIELNEALKQFLPGDIVKLTMKSDNVDIVREVTLGEDTTGTVYKQAQDGAYIDTDQGKTQIGDSHNGWSMNYPAGLVNTDAYGQGRNVFGDAKGEFALTIQVDDKESKDLSINGLLRKAANQSQGKLLEKRYVNDASMPYALVSGKINSDGYYITHAYHKEDRIYYVTLFVMKEENFKNPFKLNSYLQLLNSFTLSFDKSNKSLKDISAFKDTKTITSDYGVSFELPSEWTPSYDGDNLSFSDKEEESSLNVQITSASSGDTLKQWASRQEQLFKDSYVEEYRKIGGLSDLMIADAPAKSNQFSAAMGKDWEKTNTFYVIKDKYKYKFEFTFSAGAADSDVKKLQDQVIGSVKIDKTAMDSSLGVIQDEEDLIVPNATIAYSNKKFKYTVQVPETWITSNYGAKKDSPFEYYYFTGGNFDIHADDHSSLEDVLKKNEDADKKNAANDKDYKYIVSDEKRFDVTVKKEEVSYITKEAPYKETRYIFTKNNIVYTLTLHLNDAVHTPQNEDALKKVWESFQLQ